MIADLDSIHYWSQKWQLNFSASKSASMSIYNHRHKPVKFKCLLNDTPISEVEDYTYLGLKLNSRGSWYNHIREVRIRIHQRTLILCKAAKFLDNTTLLTIVKQFILPIVEYGSVAWDASPQYLLKQIDASFNSALDIVWGMPNYCANDKFLRRIKHVSIADKTDHNIINNMPRHCKRLWARTMLVLRPEKANWIPENPNLSFQQLCSGIYYPTMCEVSPIQ